MSGFAGAGWNYCFLVLSPLLAFSAPEDLGRHCAFSLQDKHRDAYLEAYCGWQKIDMETLETKYTFDCLKIWGASRTCCDTHFHVRT